MERPSPGATRSESSVAVYAWWAAAIYLVSLVVPVGIMGFGMALAELARCLAHPTSASGGSWIFGLIWLANPAVWAGIFFLFKGALRKAAVVAEFALLLAMFDVGMAGFLPCYYLWVASMVLVAFAALRPVTSSPTPADANSTSWIIGKPTLILCAALGLPLMLGGVVLTSIHLSPGPPGLEWPEDDANTEVRTGEEARQKFLKRARRTARQETESGILPASANNFWFYEDGGFNRSLEFGVLDCGSRDDCLRAVKFLAGVGPAELRPWEPSRYAVVMEGPGFYSRKLSPSNQLRGSPWGVPAIKNGLVFEQTRDNTYMAYFAIDLDRNRIYLYEAVGGFPSAEYEPAAGGASGQAKDKR
jgi:hypothetical protein